MFKRLLRVFKRKSPEKELIDKKKQKVKEWLINSGFKWDEFENILFWKTPTVSLVIYLVFTGLFWKFISYRLQKISLLLIILSSPCLIDDVRIIIWNNLEQKGAAVIKERRRVGFEFDDMCNSIAQIWISAENSMLYLLQLKEQELTKFCLHIGCCISVLVIFFAYIPVAEIVFGFGTIAYFFPIINYLGLLDFFLNKMTRFVHPIYLHLSNSRTKRRRNLAQQNQKTYSPLIKQSNNDDAIIHGNQLSEEVDKEGDHSLSRNSSLDEFDLQNQLHHLDEAEHSSDFDENEFLPIIPNSLQQDFLSISQYDSMMEPRDDEFLHGLNFYNASLSSHQGMVDDYFNSTDNEVEDLPDEDFETTKKDDDFEFLDHAELNHVTDDEISKQNSNLSNTKIVQGISSILGY
ncbi:reticulophagy regulator 2 isoform X2 [Hydra vulgaris]|uniref:Reticulophagy regulator 2 isoform X2 n=1 Tax=Hydra vulgaris TaxID=6087 RepID=A0ABM4CXD5_HYDVU